jgi:NADH-quinone oxidoreductase subunit J
VSQHLVLAVHYASTARTAAFWLLAITSVAAALGMIVMRRAVHCAIMLAVIMLSLAVLYAMAGAPFLAFVQVIVYTGAVLTLFLFVIMIVGITSADSIIETIKGQRIAAGLAGIGLLVLLTLIVGHAAIGPAAPASPGYGSANVTGLATLIFTTYVFPFEVTSALLITAALGAMVLAHRERTEPKPTQRILSRRRIASGRPAPLPGPGSYARHNAADMPALLPDGTTARSSVPDRLVSQSVPGVLARAAVGAGLDDGEPGVAEALAQHGAGGRAGDAGAGGGHDDGDDGAGRQGTAADAGGRPGSGAERADGQPGESP